MMNFFSLSGVHRKIQHNPTNAAKLQLVITLIMLVVIMCRHMINLANIMILRFIKLSSCVELDMLWLAFPKKLTQVQDGSMLIGYSVVESGKLPANKKTNDFCRQHFWFRMMNLICRFGPAAALSSPIVYGKGHMPVYVARDYNPPVPISAGYSAQYRSTEPESCQNHLETDQNETLVSRKPCSWNNRFSPAKVRSLEQM